MTDVPPEVPLEDVAEDVLAEDGPDPEEYRAGELEQTSDATGTVYEPDGQALATPQDESATEDDEA